jgi:hypothetical protein
MLYGTVTEFCTPQEVRLPHLLGSCPFLNGCNLAVPDHVSGTSVRVPRAHPLPSDDNRVLSESDTNISGKMA